VKVLFNLLFIAVNFLQPFDVIYHRNLYIFKFKFLSTCLNRNVGFLHFFPCSRCRGGHQNYEELKNFSGLNDFCNHSFAVIINSVIKCDNSLTRARFFPLIFYD